MREIMREREEHEREKRMGERERGRENENERRDDRMRMHGNVPIFSILNRHIGSAILYFQILTRDSYSAT